MTSCVRVLGAIIRHTHTHTHNVRRTYIDTHTYIHTSIRNIYRLQKTDYTTSITDLRKKLNWLNTEDSINYKILKKTITYNLPYNLRNKIKYKPNTRLLRNNNSTILHQPITQWVIPIASNTKGENSTLHQQLDGINYHPPPST